MNEGAGRDTAAVKILILCNGEYGDPSWYRTRMSGYSRVICTDGAARMARRIGIVPDLVVGDMDSIAAEDRESLERAGARFQVFPPEKDLTDTQIAYEIAREQRAAFVTVWGGTGSRLDHTLSTLHNAFRLVEHGIDVSFASPDVTIHLVRRRLALTGSPGDTVSLIVLGDRAAGITLTGFRYPLSNATLEGSWQVGVSNSMTQADPVVEVAEGNVAVFHYPRLPG